jgi:hypothetical protein
MLDSFFGSSVGGWVGVDGGIVMGEEEGVMEGGVVVVTAGGVVSTPSGPVHPENKATKITNPNTTTYDFFRIC